MSSCSTSESRRNTRRDVFQMLSTCHVGIIPTVVVLFRSLSFHFSLCLNSSGRGGRVHEAVPRAVSAEVQREGSWERRQQHCVLLQERQQELQSSLHGTTAGFHQVNQPVFVIIWLFSTIIQHLKIQMSLFTWVWHSKLSKMHIFI